MGITPAIIGGVGAAAGLGNTIANAAAGPAGTATGTIGGSGAAYQPQYQGWMDQLYGQNIANLANSTALGPSQTGAYQNIYNNAAFNPYAQPAINAAGNVSSNLAPFAAQEAFGAGSSLYPAGGTALSLINPLIQSSFDPQQALYNQLYNNLSNTTNATNAQYGLASSPAGAGVANNALSNFGINWQNNLLNRQLQGAQGVGNLINAGGRAYAGGSGLQSTGINQLLSGTQAPYNLSTGVNNNVLAALQALTRGTSAIPGAGSYGNISSLLSPIQSYLGLGQAASGLAQSGQQLGFNEAQVSGQNLANALTNPNLAGLFGIGNTGGGGYQSQTQGFPQTGVTSYGGYTFGPFH